MALEFEIALEDANTEEFHLRIDNEVDANGNVVPHRPDTTGTDWKRKYMTVKGRMPTVVHGFEQPGSEVGYTLAVFEWFMTRNSNSRRFRKVTLEVAFEATGSRRQAEDEAATLRSRNASATYWDPEVVSLAPVGPHWYQKTTQHLQGKIDWSFFLKGGYAPFLTTGTEFAWGHTTTDDRTTAIQVAGEYAFGASSMSRSKANAARWILLENPTQRTGVPAYIRTAVLLKRRPRDDGQFVCYVSASYKISKVKDLKKGLLKALGRLPRDQPIVFDPNVATAASYWHSKSAALGRVESEELQKEFKLISLELDKVEKKEEEEEDNGTTGTTTMMMNDGGNDCDDKNLEDNEGS